MLFMQKLNSNTVVDDFIAPKCHDEIKIIYQDSGILLINKPSGLLSLSGKNPLNKDSVHYRLSQLFPDCRLLHRLDFGTSGIMLLALNKNINSILTQQFQQRAVKKQYTAIVDGLVADDAGQINLPISKADFPYQKICMKTGKQAITQFKVVQRDNKNNQTRLQLTPITGRTHQLRLHCLTMGHPILGCDLYKSSDSQKKSERLLLHANMISFDHPITQKRTTIEAAIDF
jgi:tRNA pseudouridine32 synthase / 23S rRNA pseudouridine746 synthase